MHRRNTKVPQYASDEFMEEAFGLTKDAFFTNNFKNVYSNMDSNMAANVPYELMPSTFPLPNILNFDLDNAPTKNKQFQQTIPPHQVPKTEQKFEQKPEQKPEQKYGIKTLVNTKSKITYPFDTDISQANKSQQNASVTNNTIKPTTTTILDNYNNYVRPTATTIRDNNNNNNNTKSLPVVSNYHPPATKEPFSYFANDISKQPTNPAPIKNNLVNTTSTATTSMPEKTTIPPAKKSVNNLYNIDSEKYTPTTKQNIFVYDTAKRIVSNPISKETDIQKKIEQESLHHKENFIVTEPHSIISKLDSETSTPKTNLNVPISVPEPVEKLEVKHKVIDTVNNIVVKPQIINDVNHTNKEEVTAKPKNIDEYRPTIKETFSDIESRVIQMPREKKIDNKKDDNTIVKSESKPEVNTNMDSNKTSTPNDTSNNTKPTTIEAAVVTPVPEVVDDKIKIAPIKLDTKMADVKIVDPKEEIQWPKLNIDHINISFKVVADLKEGAKLKIVDNTHLAEDNSYVASLARYSTGQGRDKIMSYLDHLLAETIRNIEAVLGEIRSGINVDNNVSVIEGMVCNMVIFLHRYENMRNVYKSDSSTHAKLGNIRNKFFTFKHTLFREMTIAKNVDTSAQSISLSSK